MPGYVVDGATDRAMSAPNINKDGPRLVDPSPRVALGEVANVEGIKVCVSDEPAMRMSNLDPNERSLPKVTRQRILRDTFGDGSLTSYPVRIFASALHLSRAVDRRNRMCLRRC